MRISKIRKEEKGGGHNSRGSSVTVEQSKAIPRVKKKH